MAAEHIRPQELQAAREIKSAAWKLFKKEVDGGTWKQFLEHAHKYENRAMEAIKAFLMKKHAAKNISLTREDKGGNIGHTSDTGKRRPPPEMMSESQFHTGAR